MYFITPVPPDWIKDLSSSKFAIKNDPGWPNFRSKGLRLSLYLKLINFSQKFNQIESINESVDLKYRGPATPSLFLDKNFDIKLAEPKK